RPVDFAIRQNALSDSRPFEAKVNQWQDGAIKQQVIRQALMLRQENPDLFIKGEYIPLEVTGAKAPHLIAFMRVFGDSAAIVLVTRLPYLLKQDDASANALTVTETVWEDTRIILPHTAPASFMDALNGEMCVAENGSMPVGKILKKLPQALLV